MKPRILLRLIVSLVVVIAFVLGATFEEASRSLNPTAWWWAQRQLPLLWLVDGFALLMLLPIFGATALQTRLARKSEELTYLREQHETQMEDMIQHSEQMERHNMEQANNIDALESTVAALNARLNALEADTKTHQNGMETEMRRLALEAFGALANEVQATTRQMEAVSLAMQYQRAEIQQLRQSVRVVQRPHEIAEIARLTPYELAALQGDDTPLLLAEGKEGEIEEGERKKEKGESDEAQSSIVNRQSSIENPSAHVLGFYEPTMNAGTTFVSPTTEFEITSAEEPEEPEEAEASADWELMEEAEEAAALTLLEADTPLENVSRSEDSLVTPFAPLSEPLPVSTAAVTAEEYALLHGKADEEIGGDSDAAAADISEAAAIPSHPPIIDHFVAPLSEAMSLEPESSEAEPSKVEALETSPSEPEPPNAPPSEPESPAPRGLRRWFMRL